MESTDSRRRFLGTCLASGAFAASPAALAAAPNPAASQSLLNVKDFGVSGAGRAVETKALQSAIDAAGSAGGGTVLFPAGTYLTGTLLMQSHVSLHLEGGAVLLGSTNLADYPPMRPKLRCSMDRDVDKSIIYGEGLENISLAGRGTINGQGATSKRATAPGPFSSASSNAAT